MRGRIKFLVIVAALVVTAALTVVGAHAEVWPNPL